VRPRAAAWDEADLAARLCRALDLAKRVIAWFASEGYVDPGAPANSFHPEKPLAETAMLIYAASVARRLPQIATRIGEVAELLLPHARSAQTLLNMALHPALCLDFAVPHILLSKLGYTDPRVDDFLRSCLASQARNGRQRPTTGSLEGRWVESLWTGAAPGPAWHRDLRNSVLNWPLDILGGFRDDAYAFTHLVMYCTDFGFRPAFLPRRRAVILQEGESLLAKNLDAEDYDLAGEVIMAWPLTGAPWSPAAAFGFRVLAGVEDHAGALPGVTTRMDRLEQLAGSEKTRYALGTAYHTAYVMGFLCAASLREGRAPPARIAGRCFDEGFVDHLLATLDRDQGHWQPELQALSKAEQHALCPLLLDLALVQKCRKHDYGAVSELLALAHQHGLSGSPLCGQSAELLERLTGYAHAARPDVLGSCA
jgi:hypothetical protein